MTSNQIKQAIDNWARNRQDSGKVLTYFEQGDCFAFPYPKYAETSEFIHAYVGVLEDVLYFFMVPSAYDKEEYVDVIDQYTTVCLVVKNISGGSHEIPSKEAEARMKAWKEHYTEWVPAQINDTTYGLFQVFNISNIDFEHKDGTVVLSLGLKQSASAQVNFDADLIVINPDGKQLVYDDFVKSVPPFGTSAMAQNEFYLLPV